VTPLLRFLAVAAILALAAKSHAAFDCPLIEGKEGGDRLPLIFVAAGYAEADKALYEADVDAAIQAFLNEPPYRNYRGHFTFYRAWTPSLRSRVPDAPSDSSFGRVYMGPDYPMWDEDKFFSGYGDSQYSCRGRDPLFLVNNRVVFLVNYGSGYQTAGVMLHSKNRVFCLRGPTSTFLHELGHSLGELSDEYGGHPSWSSTTWRPDGTPIHRVYNVTRNIQRDSIPWKVWIADTVPIPSFLSNDYFMAIGAYEGGDYQEVGTYRPAYFCLMREYIHYCKVCQESLVSHILSYTSGYFFNRIALDTVIPIPSLSRWDSTVVTGGKVVVRRIPGDTVPISLRWRFNGVWLTGVRETLDIATLPGNGTLEAILEGASPFIRNPDLVPRDTFNWRVHKISATVSDSKSANRIRRMGPALFVVPLDAVVPQWARSASGRRVPLRVIAKTADGWLVCGASDFGEALFLDAADKKTKSAGDER
jgi:hypothetical protein